MTTRADLQAALTERNVLAFLSVIRAGEGTSDPAGYRRMFGGELFESFAGHPRKPITKSGITSTAAGAYQFLAKTWDGLVRQYGFPDFSPPCQDEAAVALIIGRGALPAVRAGKLEAAIALCNKEWASLPGSPYGQPTRTLKQATYSYIAAGGTLDAPGGRVGDAPPAVAAAPGVAPTVAAATEPPHADADAPPAPTPATEAPPAITPPPEAKPMLPFVAAALPALIEAAPALIRVFGDSPQAEKNAKAAEVVAAIAQQATGESTAEGAVRAIQADPAKAAAYREAVHTGLGDIMAAMATAHQLDEESRTSALDRTLALQQASGGRWLWLMGGVAALVILASYGIVILVLLREGFSDETRAMLLGQVVVMGFSAVMGFMFGTNFANRLEQARRNAAG